MSEHEPQGGPIESDDEDDEPTTDEPGESDHEEGPGVATDDKLVGKEPDGGS